MKQKIMLATGHNHAFHRASALAAIANGYFRDEGLPEVELGATGDDDLTVESLKKGDIDFGLDVKPGLILVENDRGQELYIIAGMLNYLDSTLIGDRTIKSISDLRGKKIGTAEIGGGRDVRWVNILLRRAGLNPEKDVTWVIGTGYGSLNLRGPQIDRGDFQACTLSGHNKRPELFELVRKAGYNILAERSETHPEGLPDRVVATTGKMLAEYPEIVKTVLKAIVRGYRFARDENNFDKIKQLYLSYNWGKEGFGWGKFDETLIDGMVRSARILPPDGSISLSGLSDIIEEEKVASRLSEGATQQQVLRLEPLHKAVLELNVSFGPEGYE